MKCPICNGVGEWKEDLGEGTIITEPCNHCSEKGIISLWGWILYHFWNNAPEWYSEFYWSVSNFFHETFHSKEYKKRKKEIHDLLFKE
jgi:hypothetical protein